MKILSGIILYLILFAKEYKKQTKARMNGILKQKLTCAGLSGQLKKLMFFILLSSLCLNATPVYAVCQTEKACKISDLLIEDNQSRGLDNEYPQYRSQKEIKNTQNSGADNVYSKPYNMPEDMKNTQNKELETTINDYSGKNSGK